MDRYTKFVLSVIAGALVYLCLVLTPLPTLRAQATQRPGEGLGPVQVIVVGWRAPANETVPVAIDQPLQVAGIVQVSPVEPASRVVIAGYEMDATRDRSSGFRPFSQAAGLPTSAIVR